ncbi:DEAD/DEAH box helicase [Mesorhizobium sp. M0027]|uniref:DEAD/DEAH box helicase n=1 Tax=unclassified Mesorhizobium TaxID=325217 RepID=UPI0003CE2F96|nr:DEAD/DEAH box helicase [Mesorhizobium sp. LSHC420B00]ESX65103.1 helicase [Mesorhizobium sp. LSHC420B00]
MSNFEAIVPALAKALEKRGYVELTPVQKAVLELGQADALVSAQTGSGKTVAFGLALAPTLLDGAERFSHAAAPLALAVAPTRELALQVTRELEWLYELTGATVSSCVGGMDMRTERRALERGAHIVVGTPGRLRDHITRNSLDMSALKAVVLDEADEMLDLGFREDLEFILDAAPAERRTLMFSATVPRSIATLAKGYQRDAVRISASGEEKQHLDIEYRALGVAQADRENAIINVLRYYEAKNALVFCNTRAAVNHLTARFNNRNFSVVALSGELSQNERSHALQAMRDGRAKVCIATDVAARGIDLPNLELVIHADLPTNPETLLHRSGRTGRAGRKGVSALIVPNNARKRTERLLQSAGLAATWASPPSADDVIRRDDERILADPVLSEPMKDEERGFVQALLDQHGPEQVAAAFVRMCRSSRSAPEDLLDVAPFTPSGEKFARRDEAPSRRDDFGDSVWFSLSVGRRQNAEPRWLIPMLCRTGGISKREIGAIKMQPEETFVQIAADWAERFLAAIGPDRKLQGNIAVKRLDGTPDLSRAGYQEPRPDKKPHRGKRTFDQNAPKFEKRAPADQRPAFEARPWAGKPAKAKFEGGPAKHKKSKKRPG